MSAPDKIYAWPQWPIYCSPAKPSNRAPFTEYTRTAAIPRRPRRVHRHRWREDMTDQELTDIGFARRVDAELASHGYPETHALRRKAIEIVTRTPPTADYVAEPTVKQVQQAWTQERSRLMDEIAVLTQALAAMKGTP